MRALQSHLRRLRRRSSLRWIIVSLLATAGSFGWGQSTTSAPADAQTPNAPAPQVSSQQKLDRVTTTVVVHGEVKDDYLSDAATSAGLDNLPVRETPLSVLTITSGLMSDQIARVLSDVVKNDASIGEDYAPVGYYGDYEIRGFPIDLATGMQINGMTISGEQDVALENKQRVEFIKGIAGLENGIASAGGVIDYATKEPYAGERPTLDLETDHRGTSYGAVQFVVPGIHRGASGLLITAAGEDIHTYVEGANGWRGMGAADGRWQLGANTQLLTDFEYQHKVGRSEAGYQLLGGTTVPSPVYPSVMLGFQPWSKPNTFDTLNAGARLERRLAANWNLRVSGSYSHSLIDDNVIWPYGPALDANGNSLCPDSPFYFFCPDGSYEIYDYRSPGELRIDAVGEALLQGHFSTGKISHDVVGGGSLFHRSVDLSSSIVYQPLGVESVYKPNIVYEPDNLQAEPSVLADFNHQASGIVQERAHLPGHVVLQAGGRFVRVSDFNYTTARSLWLPQYAATYSPVASLTLYGNYGTLLSLGPQAPWWVDNGSLFLTPFMTRQTEIGAKYERSILLTAALFRMRQPFFYPRVIDGADAFCPTGSAGDQCFESDGHETHEGIEMNAQGKAANWIQLSASGTAMRAVSTDTGTPSFDNKQVINVPRFHTNLFADVLVAHARGLHLMPGWSYTSRKEATRDDVVSVGGYNIFNLGARYTPGGEKGRITLHMYADNIFDKRYWKDTGASYGDTFIHQGAPTTVRLSAHYSF